MSFPRITKVTTQTWTEEVPADDADYEVQTVSLTRAIVWIEAAGGVYAREVLPGEHPETVAAAYRKAGRVDDACCAFGSR